MLAPKTITAGDFYWFGRKEYMYPREILSSLQHIPDGCFNHPVLVISVSADGESALICLLSSLSGMSLNAYHERKHRSLRRIHFPIHPAPPHPDTGVILHLHPDNMSIPFDKDSYIKAGKASILRVPRAALDSASCIGANNRLDPASLETLRQEAWGHFAPPLGLPNVPLLFTPPRPTYHGEDLMRPYPARWGSNNKRSSPSDDESGSNKRCPARNSDNWRSTSPLPPSNSSSSSTSSPTTAPATAANSAMTANEATPPGGRSSPRPSPFSLASWRNAPVIARPSGDTASISTASATIKTTNTTPLFTSATPSLQLRRMRTRTATWPPTTATTRAWNLSRRVDAAAAAAAAHW